MSDPKKVPAHKPSKADPIAAGVSAAFVVVALFGFDLSQYLTVNEAVALIMGVATLAASIRTIVQRVAAR